MASGDADGDVRLWDVAQPSRPELIETMNSPLGIVNGLALTPNGDILAAAYDDQVVVLWDIQNPARPCSCRKPHPCWWEPMHVRPMLRAMAAGGVPVRQGNAVAL